jgi:hypothetical protein
MCPRGSGSRSRLGAALGPPRAPRLEIAPGPSRTPTAQGSYGTATCHLDSSTHLLT